MTSGLFILGLTVLLVVLILLRLEIAFVLGIVGMLWLLVSGESITLLSSRAFAGMNEFVLLAIPFFLFAGELMNKANITDRLIRVANLTIGRFRGGLAQANVGSSLMFAGISGAAVADVAALGSVFIPQMEEEGYDRSFSAAVTASSSVVGPIIPPSIILVVYGGVTDTSVAALFAAAIVPGILLTLSLIAVTSIIARRRDLPRYRESITLGEVPKLAFDTATALTMPAIILGGILSGVFTATEAAAVACVYAILLGFIGYRSLNLMAVYEALKISVLRTVQLYAIIGFALILAWLLAREGVPEMIVESIDALGVGAIGFLLLVGVVLLFVGTWLEITAACIILAPTLHEMSVTMGIDPIHFGIVMVITLCFGLITPPLGICLFAASSVSRTEVIPIAKQVVPFFLANLAVLLVLILFPETVTYVPERFDVV